MFWRPKPKPVNVSWPKMPEAMDGKTPEAMDGQLDKKCATLLYEMIVHPIHGAEVRRIILDINPMAKFPGMVA